MSHFCTDTIPQNQGQVGSMKKVILKKLYNANIILKINYVQYFINVYVQQTNKYTSGDYYLIKYISPPNLLDPA